MVDNHLRLLRLGEEKKKKEETTGHKYNGLSYFIPPVAFSALMLLAVQQEGHPAGKKYGGMAEVGTG